MLPQDKEEITFSTNRREISTAKGHSGNLHFQMIYKVSRTSMFHSLFFLKKPNVKSTLSCKSFKTAKENDTISTCGSDTCQFQVRFHGK